MKLETELALNFIKNYPLGVIATLNDKGEPETAAVYCALDDELNIYFLSASKTRKLLNIEERPMVSLTFLDETGLRTMQIQGTGKVISTPVESIYFKHIPKPVIDSLLAIHTKHHEAGLTPAFKTGDGYQYLVKVVPTWMRLADFSKATDDQSKIYTAIVG